MIERSCDHNMRAWKKKKTISIAPQGLLRKRIPGKEDTAPYANRTPSLYGSSPTGGQVGRIGRSVLNLETRKKYRERGERVELPI